MMITFLGAACEVTGSDLPVRSDLATQVGCDAMAPAPGHSVILD